MKCGTCGRYANGICLLMDCETAENKDACPEYIEGKKQTTCSDCKNMFNRKVIGTCLFMGICTGDIPACDRFKQQPPTNGDKIRQMSNEELALMIVPKVMFCDGCPVKCEEKNIPLIDECPFGTDNIKNICVQRVIAWLNAPAESEGEDE